MNPQTPATASPPSDDGLDPAGDAALDEIVGRGPSGTFAVAGLATAIVVALYFVFYVFVYLPRGAVQ